MKAILEFNLYEEKEEFEDALNGWKYKAALNELMHKMRHLPDINNSFHEETVDKILDIIVKILNEENIYL